MSTLEQRSEHRIPKLIVDTNAALNDFYEFYREFGIFRFRSQYFMCGSGLLDSTYFKNYARSIAKAERLPFVWMREGDHVRYDWSNKVWMKDENWSAHIVIKKQKQLAPITAPLLMVCDGKTWKDGAYMNDDTVNFYFHFKDAEGRAFFDPWLEQVKTSPEMQAALRKPLRAAPRKVTQETTNA
jgi:hypothetical protein